MSLTPLEIQKTRFAQRMRGYDPAEVESFLTLVADELTSRLGEIGKLQHENRYLRQRLEEGERREHQLQETMLRAQKVSDGITAAAQREAEIITREAELTADRIVRQATEQAARIEGRLPELKAQRRELHLRLKGTLDLFQSLLEADMEEERSTATVHTLPRKKEA